MWFDTLLEASFKRFTSRAPSGIVPLVLAKVYSAAVFGVDAFEVEIEVNGGKGDVAIVVVGLPDVAVKESNDRVTTAIANSGYHWPRGRPTINLAPADVKKEGPSFDLPIALGMIAVAQEFDLPDVDYYCFVGELALTGAVRPVNGVLPIALEARRADGRKSLSRRRMRARPRWSRASMFTAFATFAKLSSFSPRAEANADQGRSECILCPASELRCRFCRRARAAPCQKRDRGSRRRRAQPPDARAARFREIDDRKAHPDDHPADDAGGSDRIDQDPQHLRPAARPRSFVCRHPAVSRAAPHDFRCRPARRLRESITGRNQHRPQRRALSRRTSRIQPQHSRSPAAAARRRPRDHFPRGRVDDLSLRNSCSWPR